MVLIKQNSRIHSRNRTRVNGLISYVIPRPNIKQINIHHKFYNNNIVTMSQAKVLGLLFLFSSAMCTLPILGFFLVDHLLKKDYKFDYFTSTCISVFTSVIIVNLIIAGYAYQGFLEPVDNEQKNTDESDKSALSTDHTKTE